MSLGIDIHVETDEARKKIQRLRNMLDVRELLQAIGNRHTKWMNDNLRAAGLEGRHKTMAASTLKVRPRRTSSNHFSSHFRSVLSQAFVVRTIGNTKVVAGIQGEGSNTIGRQAEWQHEGTGPFTIRPLKSGVLRFQGADGVVFTKRVNHPGIPARPLLPLQKTAEKLAHDVLDATLRQKTKQAGVD